MTQRRATPAEVKRLQTLIEKGKAFVGTRHEPVFDADSIRDLVLRANAPRGVVIRNVTIDGILDLTDARSAAGGPCNALILRNCILNGRGSSSPGSQPGIDASHSHLQRLSLVNCETDGVELSGAVIVGDLVLDEIHPRKGDDKPGACWVKAHGVRIGGSFTARRAKVGLPWPAGAKWPPANAPRWRNITSPYGLDLADAQIAGSVFLMPGFKSLAGVRVQGAAISGEFLAGGACLTAAGIGGSVEALNAQYVQIQGPVWLCHNPAEGKDGRFKARGALWLYGAKIGGALVLSGAKVRGATDRNGSALVLTSASLSAGLSMYEFDDQPACEIGSLDISGAVIGGAVDLVSSETSPIERIRATTVKIGGDLLLSGSISDADFSGSIIDGQTALGHYAHLAFSSVNGSEPVLKFADARIGRDLKVTGIKSRLHPRITMDWDDKHVRLRTFPLSCYPGCLLAEALFETSGSGLAMLSFLYSREHRTRIVLLDGRSESIHALSKSLDIETAEKAKEYLVLFCAHIWSDEGAFLVVPDSVSLSRERSSDAWIAIAELEYGSDRYKAEFEIEASGEVTMLEDERIGRALSSRRPLYAPPVRWFQVDVRKSPLVSQWPIPGLLGSQADWENVESGVSPLWRALWRESARMRLNPPRVQPNGSRKPRIDLEGLKVASLDDGDGWNWFDDKHEPPPLLLSLSGFEYSRISDLRADEQAADVALDQDFRMSADDSERATPARSVEQVSLFHKMRVAVQTAIGRARELAPLLLKPRLLWKKLRSRPSEQLEARLYWLSAQYDEDPLTVAKYRPQAHEQLARVWRAAGHLRERGRHHHQEARVGEGAPIEARLAAVAEILASRCAAGSELGSVLLRVRAETLARYGNPRRLVAVRRAGVLGTLGRGRA